MKSYQCIYVLICRQTRDRISRRLYKEYPVKKKMLRMTVMKLLWLCFQKILNLLLCEQEHYCIQ